MTRSRRPDGMIASPPRVLPVAARATDASGPTFVEIMDRVAQGFEIVAVGLLVAGLVWSLVLTGLT